MRFEAILPAQRPGMVFIPPNLADKCALHHPGTLPKFNPSKQTLKLEPAKGVSGRSALDGAMVVPNGST
jgi:hypothetical protein